ncbi:OsmC family peroxiredoxin [Kutzneria sp. CA-103260]|uniref:OsmC family peroxiredoxin n=1 Tax=Kutzneria sp. CA-103260 TaxID=2802641 RepID=UPI001BA7D055|nr:OsmC family peroxiredoxin [Kutzneria sp. CA-103260]QUQ63649.1 Helix-turn-helix domain protein [Kutzneria sp. CA-103260]
MTLDETQIDAQLQVMAERLRAARFARGLRLIDVAGLTGLSEVHLYRLEQGERAPSLRALLVLAAALGLSPADLLDGEESPAERSAPHTGRAVWTGTEKAGSGEMIKGAVRVRYDLARRVNPELIEDTDGTVGSPESLLGMAFAGCFSMALAADLDDAGYPPLRIETFAEVQTESGAGGIALSDIELRCEAAVSGIADAQFQAMAEATKRNCLVARALVAVPARLDARLVAISGD